MCGRIGQPGSLTDQDQRTGRALADVATIGILAHRNLLHAELMTTQLQTALASRIAIEQAKGALAQRQGISVAEAFAQLRAHARKNNLRLSDLAREVAEGTITNLDPLGAPATTTRTATAR